MESMKINAGDHDIRMRGFTLVEMAIVLLIIGLLLSGGINLLSTTSENANYKQTQNTLQEIKDALVTYYAINKRLPCPDSIAPFDGKEDASCTTPDSLRGYLPYATLGIGGSGDAWGEPIKYVINQSFSAAVGDTFCSDYGSSQNTNTTYKATTPPISIIPGRGTVTAPLTANRVTIRNLPIPQATPPVPDLIIGDWAAFALVSTARNGKQTNSGMTGAFTDDGGCTTVATVNGVQLERENCNADSILRFGNNMSDANSVAFDDLLVWEGDYQLISELRKAGVCN
jgi:prepilin-type N-terminal cleavage/methylation domain-containing protein